MDRCPDCGKPFARVAMHMRLAHSKTQGKVAVADRIPAPAAKIKVTPKPEPEPQRDGPRSARARRQRDGQVPSVIDQIPVIPGTEPGSPETGAWAYYLRQDGETIPEILIVQPNGGIPNVEPRMAARFGVNAAYYRERYAAKGIRFLGTALTEDVMRQVVDVLAANREEGINFCLDEIDECEDVISNSDRPEIRDQSKRRRQAFRLRLAALEQPFVVGEVLAHLTEIARAYQLSKLDPTLIGVLRSMLGEQEDRVSKRMQEYAQHFNERKAPPLEKAKAVSGGNDRGESFTGSDFIDNG